MATGNTGLLPKALAWEIASHLLDFPSDKLVDALQSGEIPQALKEDVADVHPCPEAVRSLATCLEELAKLPGDDLLHLLRREYTRIFIGPPRPLVSLSEGVFRQKREGIDSPLMLVNEISVSYQLFLKEYGVLEADGYRDAIDNADNECEFAQIALIKAEEDPEWLEAYRRLIVEHMGKWIPDFCSDLKDLPNDSYYSELASYLGALVAAEAELATQRP